MAHARARSFPNLGRLIAKAAGVVLAIAITASGWSTAALALQDLAIDGALDPVLQDRLREIADQNVEASSGPGGARSSAQATTRTLLRLLRSEGYYEATVSPTTNGGRTAFRISPGQRFAVSDILIATRPDPSVGQIDALRDLSLSVGDPLRSEAILNAEAQSLARLQEAGWPDATLLDREVVVDHATADGTITFNIEAGSFSRAGDVVLTGGAWNSSYIETLNPMQAGDIAQLSALRTYQAQLTDLASVSRARVQLGEPVPGTDRRAVEVTLTPAARNVLEAGFSLSTSDGGGVDGAWTRRNLLGRDESLTLSARALTREQALSASLSAPHWRQLQQTLTLLTAVRNEETDAFDQVEAEVEVDVTRRLDANWSASVKLGVDASRLTLNGQRDDTVSLASGAVAVFDNRDSTTDPSSGVRASLAVSPAIVFGDIQSGYVISEASLQTYRRLGRQWIAAGRVRTGALVGASLNAVPADDRFYAGGGGSVRGFEFQSLSPLAADGRPTGGRSVLEASAEVRWRGDGRWGAALFADAGIASSEASPDLSDLRVGLGAGVRYHFDFAPLRFDIAVPLDRRSDEASVHVYVGLGQAF